MHIYCVISVFIIRINLQDSGKHLHLATLRYFYVMYHLLVFVQDGWKIVGASNSIPDVAVRVEVLVCYLSVY